MDEELKYRPGLTDRKSIDEENHVVSAMVSVKELDRYNEVVLPQAFRGAGLRNWRKNPVVFLFHASWGFPAGRGERVEILDEGLRGFTKFATEVGGSVGDAINGAWDMIVHDYIRAWSIGFWGRDWEHDPERIARLLKGMPDAVLVAVRRVLTRGELAEWSLVGIPASPSSLTERMAKAYGDPDELLKVAPAEIREVLEFTRRYDWRKDTHLEEWFADQGCDPFCERKPQVVVEAKECEIVDLAGLGSNLRQGATHLTRFSEGDLEISLDDHQMGEKLVLPLERGDIDESREKRLAAVADQLEHGATMIREFLAGEQSPSQEQELREDIELLQVLLGSDEASPGVPGRSGSGS